MTPTHAISADEARRLLAEDRAQVFRPCNHCGRERSMRDLHRFASEIDYWVCNDDPATDLNGISLCVRWAARNDLDEHGNPQGLENRG